MKYVYVEVAGDWATLWRCPDSSEPELIWEHHALEIADLVDYTDQDGIIELEYHDCRGYPLPSGRLPRGTTLNDLLAWRDNPNA